MPGPNVSLEEIEDLLTRGHAQRVAHLIGRRRARGVRQREPDRFGHGRHGVGRELRTAGPSGRTGVLLEVLEILIRHGADRVLAYGLVDILHGYRLALEGARKDRS